MPYTLCAVNTEAAESGGLAPHPPKADPPFIRRGPSLEGFTLPLTGLSAKGDIIRGLVCMSMPKCHY